MTDNEKDATINEDTVKKATPKKRRKTKRRKSAVKRKAPVVIDNANEAVEDANKASETRFDSGISTAQVPREPEKKVGKKSWQPSSTLHIPEENKDPNFSYRALRNEPGNINKKIADGFEIDQTGILNKARTIDDGRGLGSVSNIREMIVARIPKDVKKARNEYYQGKLKSAKEKEQDFKHKMGGDDIAYGSIISNKM